MKKLNNFVEFIIGDHSHDGHEKTDNHIIKTNLTNEEIEFAYQKGVELLGFDITSYYQDFKSEDRLPKEFVDALIKSGFSEVFSLENDSPKKYEKIAVDSTGKLYIFEPDCYSFGVTYLELYLWTVKLGNSNFEFSYLEMESITIGGYGLFNF